MKNHINSNKEHVKRWIAQFNARELRGWKNIITLHKGIIELVFENGKVTQQYRSE